MRNKILIGTAILLIALIFIVRYFYRKGYQEFKDSISQYESLELKKFDDEKKDKLNSLSKGNQKIYRLFTDQFDINKSIVERDTTFSILYLSGTVKYKTPRLAYINCLYAKCITDENNQNSLARIALKEKELERKFGETFFHWYPKLKNEKLIRKTKQGGDCSLFFPDLFEISYDEESWKDFYDFMVAYDLDAKEAAIQNSLLESEFSSNVILTRGQLSSKVKDYFNNLLENRRSQILKKYEEQRSYSSSALGSISYSLSRISFDKNEFRSVADGAFEEQWKYNSLSNGAMPYSHCYGSNNYCSDYGCSRISVITGGANDVLVTIKNSNGNVVRHGYINGGHSFTFNVPDGRYQVFFYSGNGWNPNKFMTTTTCGSLRGGFVSGENFTKDSYISLYSQTMTYELILQENGNLSTQPSSMNEAFN